MTNDYIPQSEPEYGERSYNWRTAIGLQQVDGLVPSPYLLETAKANIDGKISLDEAGRLLAQYYSIKHPSSEDEKKQEEADLVSHRIATILAEKSFSLFPAELVTIHDWLFEGIYDLAGVFRGYNLTKNEWVLGGDTVTYGSAGSLGMSLDSAFSRERDFNYAGLDDRAASAHLAKFIASVWQIHPFNEGNTRTIAVFLIKYLRTLGYDVGNDTFERHSKYFRDALVRANYSNRKIKISATTEYLDHFFGNLLLGENNSLKSRHLHIDPSISGKQETGP